MSRVPEHAVDDGLRLAEGAMVYGVPLEEMTRDELIAVAAFGWQSEMESEKELRRRTEFLLSL